MPNAAPTIHDYRSLAAFLSAHMSWRRAQSPSFSYRSLCKRMGLRSTSKVAMVATGKRHPSPAFLAELWGALDLSAETLSYAQALVAHAKARTPDERRLHADTLEMMAPADDGAPLSLDSFEFIAHWWHIAILEMAGMAEFQADTGWLCARLGGLLSDAQAAASVALLIRLGLLCRDDDGRLARTAAQFITPRNVPSAAIRAFHAEALDLAKRALEEQPVTERYFSGTTVPVDPANLLEAQKLVADFRRKMLRLVQKGRPTEVYHLSVQLFRLTAKATAAGE